MKKLKHLPVLLREFLEGYKDSELSVFLDGTLGAAGHARALLDQHQEIEIFIGVDQDKEAIKLAQENLKPWMKKVKLIHENFCEIDEILEDLEIKCIDGILLDLGVSSMQLDCGERGFSFRYDAPLDMRMNQDMDLSAQKVVNRYSEKELVKIFKEYGEEKRAKAAAKKIVETRKRKKINTTFELVEILKPVLRKKTRIHPATKIFQALRICVNDELGVLKKTITKAVDKLCTNGIIAIISFHSLEDRIVKHTFRENEKLQVLTKKPITAARDENNPRSRSAKMRFAKKI